MSLTNSKLQTWLWPLAVLITATTGCTPTDNVLPPPTPGLNLSKVHVDEQRSAKATISPADGGTITATDANGVVYTLTLPEGALDEEVEIAIHPVTAIDTLPFAAGVLAGVHITPEGLQLSAPATLTIEFPSAPDPLLLVGVASKGDGEEVQLYPSILEGQKVTFDIFHFSNYNVGIAQLNELVNMPAGTSAGAIAQGGLVLAFQLAQRQGSDPTAAFTQVLHNWYVNSVKPLLDQAGVSSDAGTLLVATLEYDAWLAGIRFAILASNAVFPASPDEAESRTLAAAACRNMYRFFNERCTARASNDPNTTDPANPLFSANLALQVQADAKRWGIDTVANQLDFETALNNLCVQLVIESATLPQSFRDGGAADLRLQAGVAIAGAPVRHDVKIKFKVNQNGSTNTVIPAEGVTGADGVFTSAIGWPAGLAELKINILARVQNPIASRIRRFELVTRTNDPLVGTYDGTQTDTTPESDNETSPIHIIITKSGSQFSINYGTRVFSAANNSTITVTGNSFVARRPRSPGQPPEFLQGTLSGDTLTGTHQASEGQPEQDQESFTATRAP